jgi:hypothetical protein
MALCLLLYISEVTSLVTLHVEVGRGMRRRHKLRLETLVEHGPGRRSLVRALAGLR